MIESPIAPRMVSAIPAMQIMPMPQNILSNGLVIIRFLISIVVVDAAAIPITHSKKPIIVKTCILTPFG